MAKEKKLKVYLSDWKDGIAVVAAMTQAEAVGLFGTTEYSWELYGGHQLPDTHDVCPIALSMPGVVWARKKEYGKVAAHPFVPQWNGRTPEVKRPVVVEWHVTVGGNGGRGEWEIDWYEWHGRTEDERTEMLDEMMQIEIGNHVDAGYAVRRAGKQ